MPEQMEGGTGAQDSLFQAPGGVRDVRDDRGPKRRKGSPFIRLARPDGIGLPAFCTGWLIQSPGLPLTN